MQQVPRFETFSQDLTRAYRHADDDARRRAAVAGIEYAISATKLDDREVLDALRSLKSGATISPAQIATLEEKQRQYDDAAFAGSDHDGEPEMVSARSFDRARALASIVFAVNAAFDESLYEANAASDIDDDDRVNAFIAIAIRNLTS